VEFNPSSGLAPLPITALMESLATFRSRRPPGALVAACSVALLAVGGCAARSTPPLPASRPSSAEALLAQARTAVSKHALTDAAPLLDRLLATPLSEPVRSEVLELAAFVRLHPTPGVQDLDRARMLLDARARLPLAGTRRVEVEAAQSVVDHALADRAESARLRATAEQEAADLARERSENEARASVATRTQRQLRSDQAALRAQVQLLTSEVERLEAALKKMTAGVVGSKSPD
jgi:predicted ribosome quality control (RQC) complex YloA/Tae2 family protein